MERSELLRDVLSRFFPKSEAEYYVRQPNPQEDIQRRLAELYREHSFPIQYALFGSWVVYFQGRKCMENRSFDADTQSFDERLRTCFEHKEWCSPESFPGIDGVRGIRRGWNTEGRVVMEAEFLGKKLHGRCIFYNEDRTIQSEHQYFNGQKHGVMYEWLPGKAGKVPSQITVYNYGEEVRAYLLDFLSLHTSSPRFESGELVKDVLRSLSPPVLSFLSSEIIAHILSFRYPASSVLRFRLVSKSWKVLLETLPSLEFCGGISPKLLALFPSFARSDQGKIFPIGWKCMSRLLLPPPPSLTSRIPSRLDLFLSEDKSYQVSHAARLALQWLEYDRSRSLLVQADFPGFLLGYGKGTVVVAISYICIDSYLLLLYDLLQFILGTLPVWVVYIHAPPAEHNFMLNRSMVYSLCKEVPEIYVVRSYARSAGAYILSQPNVRTFSSHIPDKPNSEPALSRPGGPTWFNIDGKTERELIGW